VRFQAQKARKMTERNRLAGSVVIKTAWFEKDGKREFGGDFTLKV